MKKIYVLDTNVLLQDPRAIYMFKDNEIVIPAVALEELDSKKRNMDEIGRNARYVSRLIDQYRTKGKLHDGVPLSNGGILRVELNHKSFVRLQDIFIEVTNDNRILAVALNLQEDENKRPHPRPVVLVSKDALMRVKADALGLQAEDFLSDRVIQYSKSYSGCMELKVSKAIIDQYFALGRLSVSVLKQTSAARGKSFFPHQFLILKDELGSPASALGKISADVTHLELLQYQDEAIWGVKARNVQQRMALELLMRDDIPLVTLTGKAGTGKTLLSIAAGLSKTEDERRYQKLLVARPIVPMGKDIGYLPGEKEEKLKPWMQPIYDNLEYLFHTNKPGDLDRILAGMGSIEVEALTYIRGRSIPEQFIIIDEAQNLTKHEVKTIVTRVGEGSKLVLMGDPEQIDHPYLDEESNGLTYLVEKFKDQPLSGHIRLEKGERSPLAQLAAHVL
ncbi:PhoH family protein [Caldalkalibacillus thermarum TA2.A1]|uniref:PhoH family protein n=1 Tax=Caldalkalibacillus thermarum (strain TA2.A1) TaxID=986075 RepID=F5L862_CALTT|nr:PhoH family protein [Caldalkalibacillus thermarum]EGL82475.1 PhoH family protein [Caldalkalibacillus thermarum TA2.A1]QZT33176.1 PhoH family protein [Caldalkalibacillus thermarum TA2.A1]